MLHGLSSAVCWNIKLGGMAGPSLLSVSTIHPLSCALLVITGIKRLKTLTFVSGFVPAAILFMIGLLA